VLVPSNSGRHPAAIWADVNVDPPVTVLLDAGGLLPIGVQAAITSATWETIAARAAARCVMDSS
jgi:hypothetical protein